MNENIDLTKILKDCPKGWKFYSTLYGEVEFEKIKKESEYPIVIITKHGNNSDIKSDGRYYGEYDDGECTLFPSKDQRDWSKFTTPWYNGKNEQKSVNKIEPRFKVGDWVVRGDTIAQILDIQEQYYVGLDINEKDFVSSRFLNGDKIHLWTIQDAKDGDVLALSWLEDKNLWEKIIIFKKYHSEGIKGFNMPCVEGYGNTFKNGKTVFNEKIPYYSKTWICNLHPATKEQRDLLFQKTKEAGYKWNTETNTFEKLVEPKFKVGDKIVNIPMKYMVAPRTQGIISEITDDKYIFTDGSYIFISNQDSWELVSDKFDPNTLRPFDKVLVKDFDETSYWTCNLFSYYNKNKGFYYCSSVPFDVCIPYNDDTKHLVGTTEEAPDFYKYWED